MTEQEQLMLEMANAYERGISPCEYRRSLASDILFVRSIRSAVAKNQIKIQEEEEHNAKVQQALRNMRLKNG